MIVIRYYTRPHHEPKGYRNLYFKDVLLFGVILLLRVEHHGYWPE